MDAFFQSPNKGNQQQQKDQSQNQAKSTFFANLSAASNQQQSKPQTNVFSSTVPDFFGSQTTSQPDTTNKQTQNPNNFFFWAQQPSAAQQATNQAAQLPLDEPTPKSDLDNDQTTINDEDEDMILDFSDEEDESDPKKKQKEDDLKKKKGRSFVHDFYNVYLKSPQFIRSKFDSVPIFYFRRDEDNKDKTTEQQSTEQTSAAQTDGKPTEQQQPHKKPIDPNQPRRMFPMKVQNTQYLCNYGYYKIPKIPPTFYLEERKEEELFVNTTTKGIFQSTNSMTSFEIENMVRNNMKELRLDNPVLDDYYFCAFTNKYIFNRGKSNNRDMWKIPKNFLNWTLDAMKRKFEDKPAPEEEKNEQQKESERRQLFGRLPSGVNSKKPRMVIVLKEEDKEAAEQAELTPEKLPLPSHSPAFVLNKAILDASLVMYDMEDLNWCLKFPQATISEELEHKHAELCDKFVKIITTPNGVIDDSSILQIFRSKKGAQLVLRAMDSFDTQSTSFRDLTKKIKKYKDQILKSCIAFGIRHKNVEYIKRMYV